MKITVSGWPGGGSSSLSLLLAYHFEIKHLQGGNIFRNIYKELSFSESGSERVDAHHYVEPYYGPLHDTYIDELLKDESVQGLLIENDIASFRVGQLDDVCSVFLITDFDIRKKRMGTDSREDDGEALKEVDESHRKEYESLHNIAWFDEEEIREKHNLVIQNSEMTIAETLIKIGNFLASFSDDAQTVKKAIQLVEEASALEGMFWNKGKSFINEKLEEKDLVVTPKAVFEDIYVRFPSQVDAFPDKLKEIIKE